QCHQRVQKLLKENFDFTKDESFPTTRNKSPWPKDEAEADELWRLRIKLELLQGRLNKDKPEDTIKVISKRYDRLVKAMGKFSNEEVLQTYLSSLARSYDPHSEYMGP